MISRVHLTHSESSVPLAKKRLEQMGQITRAREKTLFVPSSVILPLHRMMRIFARVSQPRLSGTSLEQLSISTSPVAKASSPSTSHCAYQYSRASLILSTGVRGDRSFGVDSVWTANSRTCGSVSETHCFESSKMSLTCFIFQAVASLRALISSLFVSAVGWPSTVTLELTDAPDRDI